MNRLNCMHIVVNAQSSKMNRLNCMHIVLVNAQSSQDEQIELYAYCTCQCTEQSR